MQSGLTPNFTELFDEQSRHVAHVLGHALGAGVARLEPTDRAEAERVAAVTQTNPMLLDFARSCTPGYDDNEGQPTEGPGWFGGTFGGGPQAYFALLRAWRERGDFEGLELG
ncbi:MAG: hypothetical protein R3F35_15595 [Myxococcota bacterium]